jgi:hypothetical protein
MLYGISEEEYSTNPNRLLFGPGQGSTIGPFLWLLCFVLTFKSLLADVHNITIQSVDTTMTIQYVVEAFVDDTGLSTNNMPRNNPTGNLDYNILTSQLQRLAQEWEQLLFSTGGALN